MKCFTKQKFISRPKIWVLNGIFRHEITVYVVMKAESSTCRFISTTRSAYSIPYFVLLLASTVFILRPYQVSSHFQNFINNFHIFHFSLHRIILYLRLFTLILPGYVNYNNNKRCGGTPYFTWSLAPVDCFKRMLRLKLSLKSISYLIKRIA